MIASLLAGASHAQDPHAGHSHAGHSHGESAAETAQAPIAYPPDAVLYEASGKKHTVAEFVESVRLFPPGPLGALDIADFDLSKATPDAVKEAVEQTAVQAEAARRAREAGLEMEDARDDRMHRDLEMIEQRIWLFETGILGDTDVTDEQVRAQYDADAARSYTTPEQLAMRHIFLSTYEEYLVQAGDSLESIAEKITGDRSAADRILNAETRSPRAEEVVGVEGDKFPPKALVESEKLMVPMNDEKAAEIGKRAQEAWDKIAAGAAFEEVAAEYGENPDPGRLMTLRPRPGEKPILAEMRAAFDSIADGEHSRPFRTKHGWQIVKRESYKPQTVTPFEAVRDGIRRNLINREREARFMAYRDSLFARYDDLAIDMEALARAGDEAHKEDVIFQIDDVKYTCGLFARDFDGKFDADTPAEERRKLLSAVQSVQTRLMKWDKERLKLREGDEYKAAARRVEEVHMANRWLRHTLDATQTEPTEERLLAKFEELKKSMRKEPAAEVWQATVKADIPANANAEQYAKAIADATESLKAELAKVAKREDFSALVKQMSEDEFAAKDGFVGYKSGDYLGGMVGRALEAKVVQGVFGPEDFPDGRVVAVWIGAVDKGQQMTLDDYRNETKVHVLREMENERTDELIAKVRGEIGLTIHVPPLAP